MSPPAISLDGVWKGYPRWAGGSRTVRGILARRVPVLMRRGERRWALKDVSLDVGPGESVGLIGPNGAGKSTLLRLASGLGRPTRGRIAVADSTASILTLGESFDPSLTGRENALTAAIVAGLRRSEARARLDAAFEFAELEDFADAPVRTYSEGMKLRLAFGVLAQLQPDALLIDEVIAVGDLRFQAKCLERIRELRERGTALLLASHALEQVEDECDRAVWLQGGAVRLHGDSATVIAEYEDAMRSQTLDRTPAAEARAPGAGELELRRNRFGSQEMTIEAVVLRGPDGTVTDEIRTGDSLRVSLEVAARRSGLRDPIVGVTIHRVADGVVCCDVSTEADGVRVGDAAHGFAATVVFDRLELMPGEYLLDVGVYEPGWEFAYDFHWQAYPLRVTGRGGGKGVLRSVQRWEVAPRAAVGERRAG